MRFQEVPRNILKPDSNDPVPLVDDQQKMKRRQNIKETPHMIDHHHTFTVQSVRYVYSILYRMSHKKCINKKLLVGAAHGFNSQFLNLFGFSISASFVRFII